MGEVEFLTVPEVAARLRVSLRTVYSLIERGDLHAIRVGRLLRVPLVSLEAYLRGERPKREED